MTKTDDIRFMRIALAQAKVAASKGNTPFGAAVVSQEGNLIAKGHNQARILKDPSAHGEVVAIRNAWKNLGKWQLLRGTTLYTSTEPCLLCSFIIGQAGIRRVVYAARGTDVPTYKPLMDADFSKAAAWINSQPDWDHIEVTAELMRDEARQTLDEFPWDGPVAPSKSPARRRKTT